MSMKRFSPGPSAEFFVSNKRDWELNWKIARHFLPHARVRTVRDAIVLPIRYIGEPGIGHNLMEGGLCDAHSQFVAGRRRSFWNDKANISCLRAYPTDGLDIQTRDEDVIFGGLLNRHWGHILTDSTPRLWYVTNRPKDTRKIVFLSPPLHKNNPLAAFAEEDARTLFELAGIERDRIEIVDKPTRFRSVTAPEEAIYSLDAVRPEWISFFDAVRSRIEPSPYKKVYFSRTRFKGGDTFNEDLFESYWRDRGFHIVCPEDCTLREEISLIAGADELVATIGTLTHNFLFAKPGTKATILLRTPTPLRLQLLVGAARGLRCDYVEACRNVLPTTHNAGVFFLSPVPAFRHYLRSRGLPGFDSSNPVDLLSDDRIVPYVRRWLAARATQCDIAPAIRNTGMGDPTAVEQLAVDLDRAANEHEATRLVSAFVRNELLRLARSDEKSQPASFSKSPNFAHRAKDLIRLLRHTWFHPRHDL